MEVRSCSVIFAADAKQKPAKASELSSLLEAHRAPTYPRVRERSPVGMRNKLAGWLRLGARTASMGITKEELGLSVVVRRVGNGSTPYGWAVHTQGCPRLFIFPLIGSKLWSRHTGRGMPG